MSVTQSEKAAHFVALHQGPGAFLIGNPWDAGSARILASLGYRALATSSGPQTEPRFTLATKATTQNREVH